MGRCAGAGPQPTHIVSFSCILQLISAACCAGGVNQRRESVFVYHQVSLGKQDVTTCLTASSEEADVEKHHTESVALQMLM
jgi:hypothetical protein